MLVAVGGVSGSPGVTTTAAMLARCWSTPGLLRMLIEADPDGGVLAARWHAELGTSWSPGWLDAVAAARLGSLVDALGVSAQAVGADVGLVAGVPSPAAMSAALTAVSDTQWRQLAEYEGVTVVDVGRFRPDTDACVRAADAVLVVTDSTLPGAQLAAARLEALDLPDRAGLVVVGSGPYSVDEVAEQCPVDAGRVWQVPEDRRAAAAIWRAGLAARGLDRSRLAAAVSAIATDLHKPRNPTDRAEPEATAGVDAAEPVSEFLGAFRG